MVQNLTFKMGKSEPEPNLTAYIYAYWPEILPKNGSFGVVLDKVLSLKLKS